MSTGARTRLRYAATGAALAAVVSVGSALANSAPPDHVTNVMPRCYEDEVIVWTGDSHDACVALDDMWWAWNADRDMWEVRWHEKDERTP